MNYKSLAPDVAVASQLASSDMQPARDAGFVAIINARPDGEEPGQPSSAQLANSARAAGLLYYHVPVSPGQYDEAAIRAFGHALHESGGTALAFCATGRRAVSLWALSQAGRLSASEMLKGGFACGFDLTPLIPQAEARATRL
ncbi:TIGR01244 family sulfur transferase [Sphingomonas sp. MMS24-J13]|uniref:TIGR01244 family sulfur transferase n=1 Tax=Sphingomonas sp. MMS24-J13 TaxID=3238686 RepID=UPI00384BF4B2